MKYLSTNEALIANALSLRGLSYTASNGTQILNNIDIDIIPGKVTAILGPNGAGKSTLLKSLTGEFHPQSGAVTLGGHKLDGLPAKDRAMSVGVLPQSSSLELSFSVLEVVLLGRLPHEANSSPMRDREIGMACLDLVDLAPFSQRIYTTLSGGERQRVQLARILAQLWEAASDTGRPAFLLLDEPTSALDLSHTHSMLQLVQQIAREHAFGICVILHDLNLAALYADQVEVMYAGEIVRSGAPRDVLTRELIRRVWNVETYISEHPTESCPLIVMGRKRKPQTGERKMEESQPQPSMASTREIFSEVMTSALADLRTPIDHFIHGNKKHQASI